MKRRFVLTLTFAVFLIAVQQVGAQTILRNIGSANNTSISQNQYTLSAAQSKSCPTLSRNLWWGLKGTDISSLQTFLRATGDFTYPRITTFYGNVTVSAVKKFQCREMNICTGSSKTTGYGIMGPRTRAAIVRTCSVDVQPNPLLNSGQTNTSQSPQSSSDLVLTRSLYKGTRGTDVSKLQIFLKQTGDFTYPTITGYYGSVTVKAVQRYQCRILSICSGSSLSNGYGVVGPKTRAVLRTARNVVATNTTPGTTVIPIITPTKPTPSTPAPIVIPTPPPVTYVWNTSSWNSCSNNSQSRAVTCKGSDNNTYSDSKCTTNKPTTTNACTSTPPTPTNKKCTLNGKDIPHNTNTIAYQTNSVPYGQTCQSQTRTCSNGTLSGSYTYDTCSVSTPSSCTFNNQTVAHGNNVTAYQSSTVPFGQTCQSQVRTCADGALNGSYRYTSCTVGNYVSVPNITSITASDSTTLVVNGTGFGGPQCTYNITTPDWSTRLVTGASINCTDTSLTVVLPPGNGTDTGYIVTVQNSTKWGNGVYTPTIQRNCDGRYPNPNSNCTITELSADIKSQKSLNVDVKSAGNKIFKRTWTGGNAGYVFAFDKKFADPAVYKPGWMKKLYPFMEYVRFGQGLSIVCNQSQSVWMKSINIQQILNDNLSPNFDQTIGWLKNVVNSGVKPQIMLTGTPRQIAPQNYKCSRFFSITSFPEESKKWYWQDNVIGGLVRAAKKEFGLNEIRKWEWNMWHEPDVQFDGTIAQYGFMTKMAMNILRYPSIDIPFRLGNFVGPLTATDRRAKTIRDTLNYLKSTTRAGKPIDFSKDLNGIGLSLYLHNTLGYTVDTLPRAYDITRNILDSLGLKDMPIYIDEMGILRSKVGNTYVDGPESGIFGASVYAALLESFVERDVPKINFWHKNLYMSKVYPKKPDNYIKLAKFNVIMMLEKLVGMKIVKNVTGEENGSGQIGRIRALAGYSNDGSAKVFLFRYVDDVLAKKTLAKQICFQGLDNQKTYEFTLSGIDENNGSIWDELYPNKSYLDIPNKTYKPARRITQPEISQLQSRADYQILASGNITTNAQGKYCYSLVMPPHAVYLAELK